MVRKVNPYNEKVIESAKRTAIKDSEGMKNLVVNCVAAIEFKPNKSLTELLKDGCLRFAKESILVYTQERRAWMDRRNISYKDVDSTFNKIFATACFQICTKYMWKHKIAISSTKTKYGTVLFRMVKV